MEPEMRQRESVLSTFGPGNEGFEFNNTSTDEKSYYYEYGDEDEYKKMNKNRAKYKQDCWYGRVSYICSLHTFNEWAGYPRTNIGTS